MVEFGLCPRCRGDLYAGQDFYGAYRNCVQCGNVIYVEPPKRYADRATEAAKVGRPSEHRSQTRLRRSKG